jgi:GNAT superfamily N-acetyltransferase
MPVILPGSADGLRSNRLPAGNEGVVDIRPLAQADVVAAAQVQMSSFDDLDQRMGEPTNPITEQRRTWAQVRLRHFLAHDAGGCWAATDATGELIGVSLASIRGDLWGLSLLAVATGGQSAGVGRRLLDATLGYAEGCARAVILSSLDPRAMRLYASSGFDLHPQIQAEGIPDLRDMPASVERARYIKQLDAALLEDIDQQVRGATRGPDHELMAQRCSLFVCDDDRGRGYAHRTTTGHIATLSASDDATASDLAWRCLEQAAAANTSIAVSHVSAGQQWAISTALAARLTLRADGPVMWRGGSPPPAYLPSGSLL